MENKELSLGVTIHLIDPCILYQIVHVLILLLQFEFISVELS